MLSILRGKKGQNTAEYAVLIGLVIAVIIGMQTYIKRGVQARFKDEVDAMSVQTAELGVQKQYEPYYLDSSYDTASNEARNTTGAAKSPTIDFDNTTTQSGKQTFAAPGN